MTHLTNELREDNDLTLWDISWTNHLSTWETIYMLEGKHVLELCILFGITAYKHNALLEDLNRVLLSSQGLPI